ncbi:MAG: two-component sensor histidine kinase [Alicyclobacillus sp.]|nr:two-component sensor histidine kinase [Alicyclobacillus sp.]
MNLGVLFVSHDLYVSLCNGPARRFVDWWPEDEVASEGGAVRLDQCFSEDSEESRLLVQLVRGSRDLSGWLGTWETGGQLRHVLIDTRRESGPGLRSGVYVVIKDLGDIVALEHQLLRSDKLATVGKMAAGIAHEIRNPLTTVKGFLQVFEQRFAAAPELSSELAYTRLMLDEIERVNGLVDELLMLAKPDPGNKQPCSLAELLAELGPLLESESRVRGIQYMCEVSELPPVLLDPALIKQVLLNLARNALEAMEDGGTLKIRAEAAEPWVRVDVIDTGPGIPFYQFDKIFDTFYTTKQHGTGLGLSICQKIVAEHGGEIRVSSKGYGSTFTILLPLNPGKVSGRRRSGNDG